MKKVLMTLILALTISGSVFAQDYPYPESHWAGWDYHCLPMNRGIYARIQINGVDVTPDDVFWNIEICPFVYGADIEQRGYDGFMYYYDGDYYPIVEMGVYYENTGEPVSFKLFDHNNQVEYDSFTATYEGEPVDMVTGTAYDGMDEDYVPFLILNFTSSSTGISKDILHWTVETTGEEEKANGWYLLASPVGQVDPDQVTNMMANNYDLYYFDQADANSEEWVNMKGIANDSLYPGKGYLYANSGDGVHDTVTLTFPGSAYTEAVEVTLSKQADAEFEGWNLVGNPYNSIVYIDRSFYRMNGDGTELLANAVTGGIEPMEGVFVMAAEEGETMTFSTTAPDRNAMLALNLSRDSKVIDRAVVNFGGERTLPKFQLNANHTKVYIPQDNRDYAVVTAGEMGEMPVSFKAEKNGSYTLNFTAEEVNFAYLHLIDNKTGKDVDLLEAPAYSFDAQTSDYTSRFKLVFATGNSTDDNFAFNSNGNWIISNDGEATLQVVDVNGRIMSEETVSGCISKNINAAPGVYMLRLINGDNVKVQKIIVK